jgi:hypothetical protein
MKKPIRGEGMGLSRHIIVFLIVASSIIGYLVLIELGRRSPADLPAPSVTVPAQR